MTEIFVGRQPIFNQKQEVFGYELLYRSLEQPDLADISDQDQATTDVILNTFSEIGLDQLVDTGKAFINVTRNFLIGKYPIPFPPEKVILEVIETTKIDKRLVHALTELHRQGFEIALDDVVDLEDVEPLLDIASIAKIDIPQFENADQLNYLVFALKKQEIKLLAEKVETLKFFDYCKRLGFDYFQGYFLCKPNVISRRRVDTSRIIVMQSIAKLQDPEADFKTIEDIVIKDVSLSYKLLKVANSAHFSPIDEIKSISQAISFIGLNQLRGWLTLLLLSSISKKPHELTTIAMTRAKMCEILARSTGKVEPEASFLVGLFSVLDALFDANMKDIVKDLSLSNDITEALVGRKGALGTMLKVTIAHERGMWDKLQTLSIAPETIQNAYIEAVKYSNIFNKFREM